MADANAMLKVKQIIESDKTRKFIVVSAPGKRNKADIKITDVLYSCYDELLKTGSCEKNFSIIRERFVKIVEDLKLNININDLKSQTEEESWEISSEDVDG